MIAREPYLRALPLASLIALGSAAATLPACSSEDRNEAEASASVPVDTGAATAPAGTSGTLVNPAATAGASAAAAAGASAPAGGAGQAPSQGPAPDAGASAGAAGTSEEAEPSVDCSPVEWANPGAVPNPKVVAVPADAGTNGELFGKSDGLDAFGYLEEEFFFTGASPAYTTRMVVHRPSKPALFSGAVFMEWFNVTGGVDFAPLWALSREYFMREGHVHVSVSVQAVGANALKDSDAQRYAAISHPGDSAANAIFSQAASAIRTQSELLLGPCMPVRQVIGGGQSQSAGLLARYVSDAQPKDRSYDGHLLHSGFGAPASAPTVPTFMVSTMNEGNGTVIDQPNLLEWEVAGTSHNDAHLMGRGNMELAGDLGITIECAQPLNDFPSFWVYNAALDALYRWVRDGKRPPVGPGLQTTGAGPRLDQHGNVLGGVRIQDIDVPIATYSNANAPASSLDFVAALACGLGGATMPFSAQKLLQLYPTHEDYVRQYTEAAGEALAAGFLLQADHDAAIAKAQGAAIPK